MGDGYTKLFSDIVDSSIWDEPPELCKVWVTLLALCNADGFVRGSVGWLASKAKVEVNTCQQALDKFHAPDPHSRNPANAGRRIESVEHGWLILNHGFFRNEYRALSDSHRRVYQREWMRKKRESVNKCQHVVNMSTPASASVSDPSSKEGGVGETNLAGELAKSVFYSTESRVALHWLNQHSGRSFRETESSLAPINARMSEQGVDLDGVKQMIERQCRMWKGTKLEEYLRPSTLFGPQKFNEYYAAKDRPIINGEVGKGNPRNAGIIRGPTNYATAKPRLQREREEAERLAQQMASPSGDTPNSPATTE